MSPKLSCGTRSDIAPGGAHSSWEEATQVLIGSNDMPLQTVQWQSGKVRLIDQTALPEKLSYVELSDWREVADAIRTMIVRGAPAIGCTAALGMAQGARGIIADNRDIFLKRLRG